MEGTGTMLGAIAQDGSPPPDWDGAIDRLGATAMNDADHTGTLAVEASSVGVPSASGLISDGLAAVGIIMPMD